MDTETILPAAESSPRATRERKRTNQTLSLVLAILLTLGLWGGIAYAGYVYARDYLDTAIQNVRQENAVNLQELTGSIQQLSAEITALRENIASTDSTVSTSTAVQRRIDDRLTALDRQLLELEQSLRILREAPNVQP